MGFRLSLGRLGPHYGRLVSIVLGLALCSTACGSDEPAQPLRSGTTPPSPVATAVRVIVPSQVPSPTLPTRDFDGTVKGDGSPVLVRRSPDPNSDALGACPDGARVHVGERSTDGLWFSLAWDSTDPPASCYTFTGHERDGRLFAYIGAALVTPLQARPSVGLAGSMTLPSGTPANSATLAPIENVSPPTARPTATVGSPRTPTPSSPPFVLASEAATCAATADGQYLIRWTVTDANQQLLAGLSIAVTGPSGQTTPAVTRAGSAGTAVGTALVSGAGTYHLVGSMRNADGSTAAQETSAVCSGGPSAPAPTATAAESTLAPTAGVLAIPTSGAPAEPTAVFLGTAVRPPPRTPSLTPGTAQ
jgi:hypothetical protein